MRIKLFNFKILPTAILAVSLFFPALPALADEPSLVSAGSYYGRLDFFSSGASFSDPGQLLNGANCLLDKASLNIPAFSPEENPTLVAAYLYWSGTLFSGDKDSLFDPSDLSCQDELQRAIDCDPKNSDHLPVYLERAQKSADDTVELLLPGQDKTHTITADQLSMYGYYKSDGSEKGVTAFFLAQSDITALLQKELSDFSGTYTMQGLTADICNGPEASCSKNETCSSVGGDPFTNANASFSLVLVLQEPSWRLRRVALFHGLQGLNSSSTQIKLENIAIDEPPNGKLSYYVLEGDTIIDALSDEWVKVDGGAGEISLTDELNPLGNCYNGTINSNNITGIAGVDIDQFDISSALSASAREIDVTFSTGTDRVVLAAVNLSVAVFGPVLEYDSHLDLLDKSTDTLPALEPITYVATLSNTGNLDAEMATFTLAIPNTVKEWTVDTIPDGALDKSLLTGGQGYGLININNIKVEKGKVAEIRFTLTPTCNARTAPMSLTGEVTYNGNAFKLTAPAVTITDDLQGTCPTNTTPDVDPNQPLFWQKYGLRLEGGGGCNGLGGGNLLPLLLLIPLLSKKRNEKI